MPASTSSRRSPRSEERAPAAASAGRGAPLAAAAFLAALSAAAATFFYLRGSLLYYGDAIAHLSIARRILDSRTPGPEQIGTVWLPLPHLLMLPFARRDWLWQTGLAGTIPSAICFVIGGVFVFLAARRVFSSGAAGAAACLAVALNPNLLYLQSLAMTEAVFFAALAALLYFSVRFRETQSLWTVIPAGLAALAGSLTRYEGWFLLPFAALYFLLAAKRRRLATAALFSAIAVLGPLAWLAHNWWYLGSPLDFYNGPYSAKAIYERALAQGMKRAPGDGDWPTAWVYFRSAAVLCAGWPLALMGAAGAAVALAKRAFWPVLLLALPPAFYILSLHSAGTPIYVPQLWPHTYYNTRYAIAALPLLGFAAAALVFLAPARFRRLAALAIVIAAAAPWVAYPRPSGWACWNESKLNSEARREAIGQAADFLRAAYRPGDGILTSLSYLSELYPEAGIPLRETLHEGNGLRWQASVSRPDLFLSETWAISASGDEVARAMGRLKKNGPQYDCVKLIAVRGAPVIQIFRRVR
jgi:hypothetical protein